MDWIQKGLSAISGKKSDDEMGKKGKIVKEPPQKAEASKKPPKSHPSSSKRGKGKIWDKYQGVLTGRVLKDGQRTGRIVAPLCWNYNLALGSKEEVERNIREAFFMVHWDDCAPKDYVTVKGDQIYEMIQDDFALVPQNLWYILALQTANWSRPEKEIEAWARKFCGEEEEQQRKLEEKNLERKREREPARPAKTKAKAKAKTAHEEMEYEVDMIVGYFPPPSSLSPAIKRQKSPSFSQEMFKIRWLGYEENDDTWEPKSSLDLPPNQYKWDSSVQVPTQYR